MSAKKSSEMALVANYEARYQLHGNGENFYQSEGKNRLIGAEFCMLQSLIKATPYSNEQTFRVLEFGCGDGRVLKQLVPLLRQTLPLHIPVHIYGYEIVENGLRAFQHWLNAHTDFTTENVEYVAPLNTTLTHLRSPQMNARITLMHADIESDVAHSLQHLLSDAHANFSYAFGVLPHIMDDVALPVEKQPRVVVMQALGSITRGPVAVNLATPLEYPIELEAVKNAAAMNTELPKHSFFYATALHTNAEAHLPKIPWQCLTIEDAFAQACAAWRDSIISVRACCMAQTGLPNSPSAHLIQCMRDSAIDAINTEITKTLNQRIESGEDPLALLRDVAGYIWLVRE